MTRLVIMICLQCIPAHNWSFLVYLCGTQWFTLSFLWARVPARALPALCVWGRRGARRRGGRGAPCTVGASIGIDPAPCQACYVPGATSDFSCAPSPFCVRHPPTAHDARRRGLHYRCPVRLALPPAEIEQPPRQARAGVGAAGWRQDRGAGSARRSAWRACAPRSPSRCQRRTLLWLLRRRLGV